MSNYIKNAWSWIKYHKHGVLYGAGVGLLVYFISGGPTAPLFSVAAPSPLDNVVTVATQWKYLIALLFVGAGAGSVVEMIAKRG